MASFLDRLGRTAARRHWWFVGAWLVAAILCAVIAVGLDGQTNDSFKIPGAQSQKAIDLLEAQFPSQAGATATVVFNAPQGVDDPQVQSAIQASVANLEQLPHVASVGKLITATKDPYAGKIALATVQYNAQVQDVGLDAYDLLQQATKPAAAAGVQLAYGGAVVDYANRTPSGNADLIGLLAAVFILLFAFGSVVAMGLPILTALFGLGVGVALINIVAAFTTIGTLAPTLATMIGLGVGIDYSLFIVTRYRENVADGMTIEAAAGHSVATAGQAVLFAGCTVVIAICGLAISGIPYVAKLGYMAALVVAVMMLAAITLLPAVIGLVGKNINRWRVPSLIHHRDGPAANAGGVDVGALGHDGRAPRVAVRGARRHDPAGPGVAGAEHAPRRVRRRQPPHVHHPAAGLRPHRQRLRARHQRPLAGGRVGAELERPRSPHRHLRGDLEASERGGGPSASAQPRPRPIHRSR